MGGRARRFAAGGCLAAALALAGCPTPLSPAPRGGTGAGSLLEIGQTALEQGEQFEEGGDPVRALGSYRRAVWAFSYYAELSGRDPVLLDDAEYNVERLAERLGRP